MKRDGWARIVQAFTEGDIETWTGKPIQRKENSMTENQNVESDSKGFIPEPGNEDEGQVAQPTTNVTADPSQAPEPVDGGVSLTNHDDEDVDAALGRETEDGPGFGDESQLPPEDFDGFAGDDVEVTE